MVSLNFVKVPDYKNVQEQIDSEWFTIALLTQS